MNKLVKVPSKLDPYLSSFSDLFTRPSYTSFCHMIASISVCDKSKTIFSLHETMADDNKEKKGRSSYDWFITDGDWDEEEIASVKRIYSLKSLGSKKRRNRILLIIDDTITRRKVDTPKV